MNVIIPIVVFFVLLVAVIVIYYYLRYKWSAQSASVTESTETYKDENTYKLTADIIKLKEELSELDNITMRGSKWEKDHTDKTNELRKKENIVNQILESNRQEYIKKIK